MLRKYSKFFINFLTFLLRIILLMIVLDSENHLKVTAINCYQCDSNSDLECSEIFDLERTQLKPKPCDDVYEASYCIKTTGLFGGQIGTIRNCSSRDLGDRCSFVKRSGDQRYIRSCVYTCSSDACNHSSNDRNFASNLLSIAIYLIILMTVQFYCRRAFNIL
ncbi:hypothetical protein NH340_JMT03009 [Sarcoptes scabiei]|nr:hypothetical protein NH340_JMT03009 [Sarcoptes scabiei]